MNCVRNSSRTRVEAIGSALVAVMLSLVSRSQDAPTASDPATTITSLGRFWALAALGDDEEYRIQCKLVVNFYDPYWRILWVENEGEGTFLQGGTKPLGLNAPQAVELIGIARPGRQEIDWERTHITILNDVELAPPISLNARIKQPEKLNLRRIIAEGLVAEQTLMDSTHVRLQLIVEGASIHTYVVLDRRNAIPQFKDALVRLRGVFSVKQDQPDQPQALEIWVNTQRHVEVTFRPPPAPSSPASTNVLTKVAQVLNLAPEQAAASSPVRISGVVTCFEPRYSLFFVQDETAGIYVMLQDFSDRYAAGDRLEVSGVSARGLYAPIVHASDIEITGRASLPAPAPVSIEEVLTGKHECRWIEVTGVIRRSFEASQDWFLELGSGPSRIKILILRHSGADSQLEVGSQVRIRGVGASEFDSKEERTGIQILVPSADHAELIEPPARDPFESPVRLVESLHRYSPMGAMDHQVRVRGVVTLHWPGRFLYLQDESGAVRVETDHTRKFSPGDVIDAVAFPGSESGSAVLEAARVRFVEHGVVPSPIPLAPNMDNLKDHVGAFVVIDAVFAGRGPFSGDADAVTLQWRERWIQACVSRSGDEPGDWIPEESGAPAKVSGIWIQPASDDTHPDTFRLLLRSPKDFAIGPAPLSRRFEWLIRILPELLVLGLVGSAWMLASRRRIRLQTAAIQGREVALAERYRDLFESANDMIYTVDPAGCITSVNQAACRILGYSRTEVLGRNIADIVAPHERDRIRGLLKEALTGKGDQKFEVEVDTGRSRRATLEATTRVQTQDDRVTGIQGIARDISDRKATEEALRRSESQVRQSAKERERLARDLHDSVIQSIYAVGLNLDDCRRTIVRDSPALDTRLAKVVAQLNSLIREVRSFLLGFRSRSISGSDLESALTSLSMAFGESFAARVRLDIDPEVADRLSSKQATQLLQIAREAVSNSVRHAAAESTAVCLRGDSETISFEVFDDGVGFNSEAFQHEGSGLRNMAERAKELGAPLALKSQIGQGTRIRIEIPVHSAEIN